MTGALVERTASRIPGTCRIVPTDTTGLDGGKRTTSASCRASITPGPGVAVSTPTRAKPCAGIAARCLIHHSWKWIAVRVPGSSPSTRTCVSARSSVIGRSSTPGCQRVQSAAVTADSGYPACSIWVRTRWVAVSRSPRPNQSGWTPYAASSSLTTNVSSSRPHPRSALMPPPRVYITVSRSGHTRRPKSQMSSPVLPMTVTVASRRSGESDVRRWWRRPRVNRAPPIPPASTVMRMAVILSSGRTRARRR